VANLGVNYQDAGRWQEAMPLLEEAYRASRKYTRLSWVRQPLHDAYTKAGDTAKLTRLLLERLAEERKKLPKDSPQLAGLLAQMSRKLTDQKKWDEAVPLLRECLTICQASFGPDHSHTLATMNQLGWAYWSAQRLDQSIPLFEEGLKLSEKKLGREAPLTLRIVANLGVSYKDAGRWQEAVPLLEEAYHGRRKQLGPEHADTLDTMGTLALGYAAAGKPQLATPLFEELLKQFKAKFGPDHPHTFKTMHHLAEAYRVARKLELAVPLLEQMLLIQKAKLGPDHPATLNGIASLGLTYESIGKRDQAVPLFEQELQLRQAKLGPDDPSTVGSTANLLRAYTEAGAKAKAGGLLTQTRQRLPKDSPKLAQILATFSLALLQAKAAAEAEPLLRECLSIRAKAEPEAWTTFNTQSLLGGSLLGQKKYTDAEPLLLKGYAGMKAREKTIPPQGSARIPEALDRLVELYVATNQPDEVKKWRGERGKYRSTAAPGQDKK
jgi:tetratricopeptide (TPR) repeat protein